MYQYKPEDVDCKYCAEWRHRRCQAAGCPWLAERIEAGKVSYATVILKLFRNVKDEDIVGRIGQLVLNFRGSLWLSAEHEFNTRQLLQSVGFGAWRDPRYFSALYLFGSNRTLLKRAWNACLPQRFIPEYICLVGRQQLRPRLRHRQARRRRALLPLRPGQRGRGEARRPRVLRAHL